MRAPRPLDFVPFIKLKLGLVIIASGMAGLAVFWSVLGWKPPATSLTAVGVALLISQILAHGMTRPLREMTAAAKAMARGDYSRRVRATSRDEVGQLAVAFNQMAADLAAADRQRRELIANVSHELRTPIFALQAVLENVVDGVSDPDTLRTALAQTERLGRLVTELLDMSRIDAGVVPLDREPFDVAEFLTAAVREAEVAMAAAGRDVRFVVQAAPGKAVGDPGRLHQVVANLLDNAARHSPPAGTVTAAARQDADQLVLEVTDEGPGIPPDQRARVFERFTRGERAPGHSGGTGLGLAIAQWVVELHGGSVAIVDAPGRGCRIRVSLPIAAG
ncbi:MAG: two-component sensor histidine kinase [Actinobacteria bacterium 13_2_20CM_2_71_6]|nr:MAG: two-component sensor histidine kinase [Actinobacteria bacterium 13_2_20CM_2_71_6]